MTQVTLDTARGHKEDAVLGEFLVDPLPPIDFGRIAAQTAKQVIVQKVREAERKRQFAEFKDRVGEVINGMVKRVEFGNVIVDLGGRARPPRSTITLPNSTRLTIPLITSPTRSLNSAN